MKIKEARKKMNLTQEELARKVGVKLTAISNYENEKRKPRGEIAKKLSKILNIPLEEII